MPMEDTWVSKFICAVRLATLHTSDIEWLAHQTLKTYETALSPADVPNGRLRKYLRKLMNEATIDILVSPPTQLQILGAEYTFEQPCFQSVFLATVLLCHAHTSEWSGLLTTFPDALKLTYRKLTFKDLACVAIQLNHMCAGMVDGEVGCFLTFACLWALKAGVRLSAPTICSPPDEWAVSLSGRAFLPPHLRFDSIRSIGCPLSALAAEFAMLPVTLHCAFVAKTFTVSECTEIAISNYLGVAHLPHLDLDDAPPCPSVWRLLEIGGEEYRP